jgi:hypothetical protein
VSVEITELGRYATFAGSGSLPDNDTDLKKEL